MRKKKSCKLEFLTCGFFIFYPSLYAPGNMRNKKRPQVTHLYINKKTYLCSDEVRGLEKFLTCSLKKQAHFF